VLSGPVTDPKTAPGSADAGPEIAKEPPVSARFVDAPAKIDDGLCVTTMLAVVKGSLSVAGESLAPGDVLVLKNADAGEVKGAGLFVEARTKSAPCAVRDRDRPAQAKTVVRAKAAPKLAFAGGKMSARLDVDAKTSPDVYLGRLEGSAGVPEHDHASSWEILAAVDAAGTFTLGGEEHHLGPKQVVVVPPGTKHSWKPDTGSKLVAVQMYAPPGPEQRFVALAEAEKTDRKDAGVATAAVDAGKR